MKMVKVQTFGFVGFVYVNQNFFRFQVVSLAVDVPLFVAKRFYKQIRFNQLKKLAAAGMNVVAVCFCSVSNYTVIL